MYVFNLKDEKKPIYCELFLHFLRYVKEKKLNGKMKKTGKQQKVQ